MNIPVIVNTKQLVSTLRHYLSDSIACVVVAMFSCLFTVSALGQPRYGSEASIFMPPVLADKGEYQTFSQKELHSKLSRLAGTDNSFVGQKVKVFARYHIQSSNWINKTRVPDWKQATACQLTLCDSLERLATHRNDPESLAQGGSMDLSNFTTGAYFPNPEQYRLFLQETHRKCSFAYPCYVWVVGKLGFVKGPRKYQGLVNLDLRIAYIEVEDILMIEGKDNAVIEILSEVVPVAARVKSVVSGFRSVLR
jgi:hypothetical protein